MIIRFGFIVLMSIFSFNNYCLAKTPPKNAQNIVEITDKNRLDFPPHYSLPDEVQERQKLLDAQDLNSAPKT